MKILVYLLLMSIAFPSSAQSRPPTDAQFKRTLVTLQTQTNQWNAIINEVNVEQLPVGYAHGKLIQQSKDQAMQWVRMVSIASQKVMDTDSLAMEINLSYMLNEAGHSIIDLSTMLVEIDIPKGKQYELRNKSSKDLMDIASGPINTMAQSSLAFVMSRADEIQRRGR